MKKNFLCNDCEKLIRDTIYEINGKLYTVNFCKRYNAFLTSCAPHKGDEIYPDKLCPKYIDYRRYLNLKYKLSEL